MTQEEQEGISDTTTQISLFKDFIERYCLNKLTDNLRKDKNYLEIDYNELSKFNPELAELLLNQPEDTLKATELAIEGLDIEGWEEGKVRFFNLPKSASIGIGEVRKEHFDKFFQFEGLVVKVGDIIAGADSIEYECGSCGDVINVLQLNEDKLCIPQKCGCGRKKGFRELKKTLKNVQHIIVEEYITDYTDKKARPTTIKVILEYDLANEELTKKLQPGRHVRFTGIVKSKQIKESIFFSFRILCNHIKLDDKSLFNLKVPDSYIKKFKEMKGNPNLIEDISESIFHGIEGQGMIKKILAVSRARGVKSYHQDGRLDQRDTINVGMIGDPGTAKSQMGKMAVSIDVIQMTVSGKGVSGPGLTSTTKMDKELGCWCISGEQQLITNQGLKKLKDIKIDDIIYSIDDSHNEKYLISNKVITKVCMGEKNTLKILLNSGNTITCTSYHQILTKRGWVLTTELKNGDLIVTPYKDQGFNPRFDSQFEFEKGFILGFGISDIYLNPNSSKNDIRFDQSIKNKDRYEYVIDLIKKIYNVKKVTRHQREARQTKIGMNFSPTEQFAISSKELKKDLLNLFERDELPNLSHNLIIGFLSGILSTDCCISHCKRKKGIRPRLHVSINRTNTHIKNWNLTKPYLVNSLFHMLGIMTRVRNNKVYLTSSEGYSRLFKLFKQHIKGKNYGKLIEISTKELRCKDYDLDKSKKVIYNKVLGIERGKLEEVYDLKMEKSSNFLVCGGIVHNCTEIGAGPRCTKGSLFIDEGDKIDDKDTSSLNEGMVNLSFITAKAGGNPVTLPLDTNIIMAVNPEGRKFDPMIDKYRQSTLKPDFRERFDIWVAVEKITGTENQNKVIGKIISRFSDDVGSKVGKYDLKFLQYYYAWIIQTFKPKINSEVGLYAKDEISRLMNQAGKDEKSSEISYRLVENIIRFGIASARIQQKDDVTKEDIDLSIEFQKYGFKSLDMLDETGQVSVEKIEGQVPVEVTRKKYKMEDLIKEMFDENKGPVLIKDILKRWVDEGNTESNGEEWIEKLLRNGDCFSPKSNINIRPI